jgi:hypothetical protein
MSKIQMIAMKKRKIILDDFKQNLFNENKQLIKDYLKKLSSIEIKKIKTILKRKGKLNKIL